MHTATDLAHAVQDGEVSPVELVEEVLERAEAWQPVVNAFSALRPEDARAAARARAEAVARWDELGPLHGVPVAVKDLFDVAGWETTGCCRAYRGRVAQRDAEAVRRLRAAGAVVIGKTNQHELAAGATNLVSDRGPTRNPWDPGRMTGGSSGGSGAAVAARVVPLAFGTDTGGSIRIPASMCGVAGLKPTHGRTPLDGVMPLAPSMDTVGPMGVTAEDVALAFAVLAGEGPGFLEGCAGPIRALRLATLGGRYVERVEPELEESLRAAAGVLEAEGARRVVVPGDLDYDPEDWERLGWTELFEAHRRLLERPSELGASTRRFLEYGRDVLAAERAAATQRALRLRVAFLDILRDADALLVPVTPFAAPRLDATEISIGGGRVLHVLRGAISILTRPVNMAGLPALSLVVGFSGEGLPLGVQLVGRPGDEATLLRLGRAFQEATEHHRREPPPPSPAA